MRPRAGLFVDKDRLTLAVVSARGKLDCLDLDAGDNPGARLADELDRHGYKRRRVRVGLDRSLVVVKVLELPRVGGADFGQMVRFELELYVPFPPEDRATMASDWSINPGKTSGPGKASGPLRVLVGACESRTVNQALRLLREARRRPRAVSVACHDLRALLPHKLEHNRAVWAHRHDGRTDLVFLGRGLVRSSRVVPDETPEELVREIQRSLPLLQWRDCQALWITGDEAERFLSAAALAELGAAVSEPPYAPNIQTLVDTLPKEHCGAALLALAVAVGSSHPRINLLPPALRPRRASRGQAVTAVMLGLTVVLGLGLLAAQVSQRDRYVNRLSQEIRQLDPEVRTVQGLAAEVAQKKKLVSAIRRVEANGLRALPFLRDLTELIPQDAWLQSLNMDSQGVEIIGQAGAAGQLIPTLESSPWLERVEFTSPVTKGQGKEQFRLRASWERR
ncbi:MAG TPA: PilN domain-containing protein [Methylomirabilota bacterium]